ncbi:MAG: acyltransferase [Asticcacaulis sp.]
MKKHAANLSPRAGGASLDVLRFLAAAFILLFHFGVRAPTPLADMYPVFSQGWLATDFFLLLSGFILSRAYGKRLFDGRISRVNFVIKRVARFWPSHAIMLFAMLGLVVAATAIGIPPDHSEADLFIYQLFLVYAWGVTSTEAWNVPTWTLSVLVVCYALFSLYAAKVYKCRWWQWALMLIAVLVVGNTLALMWAGSSLVDLSFRWGLLRGIPIFIIGSLLERLSAGFTINRRSYAGLIMVIIALVVILSGYPREIWLDNVILGLLGISIVLSAGVTFHENALTRRMGRMSLSLFLTHSFVGMAGFGVAEVISGRFSLSEPMQWLLWWGVFVGAIIFAALFDALIDKPLSERIARLPFVAGKNHLQR